MRNFKNLLKLNKKDSASTACFGVPLDEVVARSKGDIPIVVEHIIQNLEECGMISFFGRKNTIDVLVFSSNVVSYHKLNCVIVVVMLWGKLV